MKKEKKEKKDFSLNAKKGAALAIMFSIGVSAFAQSRGNGRLFADEPGKINGNAITDYLELEEFVKLADRDDVWTQDEKDIGNLLTRRFEDNYGPGSIELITQAKKENMEDGFTLHEESRIWKYDEARKNDFTLLQVVSDSEYKQCEKKVTKMAVDKAAQKQRKQFADRYANMER